MLESLSISWQGDEAVEVFRVAGESEDSEEMSYLGWGEDGELILRSIARMLKSSAVYWGRLVVVPESCMETLLLLGVSLWDKTGKLFTVYSHFATGYFTGFRGVRGRVCVFSYFLFLLVKIWHRKDGLPI